MLLQLSIGLLPVLAFLAALLYLDSYKLVSLRVVMGVVACGVVAALCAYVANGWSLDALSIGMATYARYVSPVVEELLKALVVIALIRAHRVGFLVDAAILGFAVGTGFALVENLQYQRLAPGSGMGTWIVRGFGTALMHGGATAIFAIMSVALAESGRRTMLVAVLPGLGVAMALHSVYNHTFVSPLLSTIAVLVVLPPLIYLVFRRSERALGNWLGKGFDEDTEMLASINSGRFSDSPSGKYLSSLRDRFRGPVVADLLCYLRINTELALRAKGLLLMRENGFEVPPDAETRAKLDELRYLEASIGRTGLLALRPLLRASPRELWQRHVLE